MKTGDLRAAPYNPRKIRSEKLDVLGKTMRELGDVGGIVSNRRTGRLVGGHQRLKVIPDDAQIEIAETFDPPTPTGTTAVGWVTFAGERFAYREVDWPEAMEKAANIAANNSAGRWDLPSLSDLLVDLDTGAIDMELTGFLEVELERLLAPLEPDEDEDDDDDGPDFDDGEVECPECGAHFVP